MGIYDYENMLKHEIYYKDGRKSNLMERTKENMRFIIHYVNFLVPNSLGRVINTHVFKYTKLREEIYALTCRLYDVQDKTVKEASQFTFFVNETSFWNRFHIYTKDGMLLSAKHGISVNEMLNICEHDKDKFDRIDLNLIPAEKDELHNSPILIQDEAERLHIYDDSIVVIDSHINYNKRVWCELFDQQLIIPSEIKGGVEVVTRLGNYKTPGTILYYDPNDPEYEKYSPLYL